MGQPARRRATPSTPLPARPTRRLRPASGAEDNEDVARMIAEKIGRISRTTAEIEVTAKIRKRQPHDMFGTAGYSLVSNYFLRRVLPYCLMHNIISKLQGAVLSNFIGRQERALITATQEEVAKEIGVGRTSVGPAIDYLCELNLLRKVKRGHYQLNPRVAFNGNGDEQKDFLTELRALRLENKFPDELDPVLTLFSLEESA